MDNINLNNIENNMQSEDADIAVTVEDQELYRFACDAMQKAYAPYSKYKVGAALKATNGEVFTGVNVENSSFGATICAERSACVSAVSKGITSFDTIAIVSSEGIASPCGICRQFLYEFEPNLRVVIGKDEASLHVYRLSQLLAEGFLL